MRKKLLLGICTFATAICLVACGSGNETDTYGDYTATDLENFSKNYMSSLEQLSEDDLEYYASAYEDSDDVRAESLSDFLECYDEKGEMLDYKDFVIDKSGKTLTTTLTTDYTGRDLKLIFVFNANDVAAGPTAINVEPVYSLGETMQKAGLNTVMGILIVFLMLVAMSLVISLFRFIPNIQAKFTVKSKDATPVAPAKADVPKAQSNTNDLELVAVIAAAIAASTGASTDSFVVRSIKKRH